MLAAGLGHAIEEEAVARLPLAERAACQDKVLRLAWVPPKLAVVGPRHGTRVAGVFCTALLDIPLLVEPEALLPRGGRRHWVLALGLGLREDPVDSKPGRVQPPIVDEEAATMPDGFH
jgi:hypothetical protein